MKKSLRFDSKSPEERSPFWWLRWVPTVVVSAIILYFFYIVGSVAVVPVLASFALAYLLNPIVYQAEKRGLSRTVSAVVAILARVAGDYGIYGLCRAGFVGGKLESGREDRGKFHAGKRGAAERFSQTLFARARKSGGRENRKIFKRADQFLQRNRFGTDNGDS